MRSGPSKRDFGRHVGDALGVAVFFKRQVAHHLQTFRGAAPGDDRGAGFFKVLLRPLQRSFVQVAFLVVESDIFRHVEAGDAFGKALLKAMAAKLAVGDDGIAVTFLLRDDVADRLVLRLGQCILGCLTAVEAGKDLFELRRPHHAADMIDAQIV